MPAGAFGVNSPRKRGSDGPVYRTRRRPPESIIAPPQPGMIGLLQSPDQARQFTP